MYTIPTVGRVVYFHPAFAPDTGTNELTLPAIVCKVNPDDTLNLAAFDENGQHMPQTNVQFVQDGGPRPGGAYAEWMPFQIAQAKAQALPPQ